MAYKLSITEEEYDNLNWYEQKYYYYCDISGMFILKSDYGNFHNLDWEE